MSRPAVIQRRVRQNLRGTFLFVKYLCSEKWEECVMGISVISFFIKWRICEKPVRRRKMAPPAMRTGETISIFHAVKSLASSLER